jgi:type IV conjugative transfer system coupling protein TraD
MSNNSSNFRNFTRGGQITLHSIRMFWQVLRYGIIIATLLFGAIFYWRFNVLATSYDCYAFNEYIDAKIKVFLHGDKVKHLVKDPSGFRMELRAIDFVRSPNATFHLKKCFSAFWTALWQASGTAFGFLGLFAWFFHWKGKIQNETANIAGQDKVEPKELCKLLKRKKKVSDFNLAGVPLVKGSEPQHVLLAGTTGTGKTVAMKELMDQVREKGQRAVVYDIDGSFVPTYYRHDKDILLNPLDQRAPSWNIWQECSDLADFDTAALSLMPEHLAVNDPFWIRSAHTIFACAALRLQNQKPTTQMLLDPIFGDGLQSLATLVAGTPAAPLVSSKIEKTALSIQATLSTYCKSLIYLKEETDQQLFSMRKWIESGKDDSWLFIASNEKKVEALRPLLSVWLDVAAKSILSLEHSQLLRLWFFVDELPSLHKLPSIMTALSRGRKYGAAFVAAIQDIHQLHSIYGRNDAGSLTALFNTKVFYRTQEPDSAVWMSHNMGEVEILEKREGFSYGAHEMRDGVSINHERRKQSVVRPAEFSELEDLSAYLRLPGNWPVTQLEFEFKARENLSKAFEARNLDHLLVLEQKIEAKIAQINEAVKTCENKVNFAEQSSNEGNTVQLDKNPVTNPSKKKNKWRRSKRMGEPETLKC